MASIYEMAETRHGQMVVLSHDTYISRSLIEYGEWTESEFELMAQALQPGDHVIDVGANIGALTLAFAAKVASDGKVPAGHVFAFEPQPRIFQLLATNCVLNGATNARLFNAGCGAAPGEMRISEIPYESDVNYGALSLEMLAKAAEAPSAPATRAVPILKLDDVYDRDTLKLIKIDVEGMELDVLKGAERLLTGLRPLLYIENEFPEKSQALLEAIREMGFEAWWHIAPCFNPHNLRGRKDDIFAGAGCVNMLCVPKEKAGAINGLTKVDDVSEHPRKAA
jgi:FkbM family methyltransferase